MCEFTRFCLFKFFLLNFNLLVADGTDHLVEPATFAFVGILIRQPNATADATREQAQTIADNISEPVSHSFTLPRQSVYVCQT